MYTPISASMMPAPIICKKGENVRRMPTRGVYQSHGQGANAAPGAMECDLHDAEDEDAQLELDATAPFTQTRRKNELGQW